MTDDRATMLYRHRAEAVSTDVGEGDPVVFAHGTLMDRTMFDPQLAALRGEYRAVAYDLRARTDRCADEYYLSDLVEDCAAFLDGKGIDSCVLGGMSMGGFMAMRFAVEYPERVDGLVLVDTMAMQHDESDREQYGQMIEQTREAGDVPEGLADIVKNLLFGATTNEQNQELVDEWVDRWLSYPGEAIYRETSSWLHRDDFTDRLPEIDVPVLITHGEEDISIEVEEARDMSEHLPDARFEVIPEAGHSSNLENPQTTNAALMEFLAEVY